MEVWGLDRTPKARESSVSPSRKRVKKTFSSLTLEKAHFCGYLVHSDVLISLRPTYPYQVPFCRNTRYSRDFVPYCISMLRIESSRGFSELAKNVTRSCHGHCTPSPKISCKSVQPFARNLANKETKIQTNKQTNKEIDRKQYPVPRCTGVARILC